MKRAVTALALVGAVGTVGTIGFLFGAVFRPHFYLRDQLTLRLLETQVGWDAPEARTWHVRFQTGSSGATLYGLVHVDGSRTPPEGVEVFRLVDGEVIWNEGLYEGQIYEVDCHSCAPRSIGAALESEPGSQVWGRTESAWWFD